MTEHPTLGPTDTMHLGADEPSAAADITAAFTDLVCADHELLRAEFETRSSPPTSPTPPTARSAAARPARSWPGRTEGYRATVPPRQRFVHNEVAPPPPGTHGPGSAGRLYRDWTAWPDDSPSDRTAEQGGRKEVDEPLTVTHNMRVRGPFGQ